MWSELLQSLSSCKELSHLNLADNSIGDGGRYLAQSIISWGDNPPLKHLYLSYCAIPEQVWAELFQSLFFCKQVSHLNLSDNTIGEAGCYLAQSIMSWGDIPLLDHLYLSNCSIPEQVWHELLQTLSFCKQLSDLDLSRNTIGEAGYYLGKSIKSWEDDPVLKYLNLSDCSISEQVWPELFQSLSSCKQLSDLDLSRNTIGEMGYYFKQLITSWGDDPPLESLDLYD